MKKLIVVAVFAMASFGASAEGICESIGKLSQTAAELRDSGVPKEAALMAVDSKKTSKEANEINKSTVLRAYQMTNKTPKEMFVIARDVCISTFGNK